MPKVKISEFSSTPANNTDIDSINIAEGCAPSGINDAIRELMAQLKDFQVGSAGDPVTVGGVLTVQAGAVGTPAITTAGDTNTGIFFPAADTIAFAEGGAEAMRLDASGNLGLGVTPSAWSGYKVLQAGIASFAGGSSGAYLLQDNAYTDNSGGAWKYINSGYAASQYYAASGSHVWRTAASGTAGNAITFTQAMTLDADGDLGIGTSSPSNKLHVYGASGAAFIKIEDSGGITGKIQARSGTSLLEIGTTSNHGTAFYTNNIERAQIDSSGNLLVGVASSPSNARFACYGSVADYFMRTVNQNATPAGMTIVYSNAAPNNGGSNFLYMQDSSTLRATFASNGGLVNYSANNVNLSDRREKTNFAPAKSYLDVICSIPVQTFNYIDQNLEEDDGLTLGVVAQDVEVVAPELVKETNWGTKDEPKMRLSIYQTDLQYALMKCIQEQQAIIESLKARLDAANL
jgi:hypothetical protein